ncbi:helix-hairpin-helix domain-containing protein [Fundidesulfovibrio terrae]|uniref:helix-hairpin-helix domain-containing protein n=1 Tax=Fundidesulfovibrio terrae TaxID=2922866 RepID=UPI001FB03712|nr:helix-hairpin-helix domain-containing protein [Fundidesulfovibrio terrae]
MDKQTEKLLRTIPGVGPAMARDLWDLGIRTLEGLAAQDPEEMYERLRVMAGGKMDRCVLYVFRSAVYFAKTPPHLRDPQKLLWWTWKDARLPKPH